jgi:hypothetical protein
MNAETTRKVRSQDMVNSTRGHLALPSGGIDDSPAMRAALVVPEHAPEVQCLGAGSPQHPEVHDPRSGRQRRHLRTVGRTLPQRRGAGERATPLRIQREKEPGHIPRLPDLLLPYSPLILQAARTPPRSHSRPAS